MVNFKKLRQMIEVKGNGNIVSVEKQVSSFLRLHLGGMGLIELYQSDEEKVVIECDENLQDYFDVQNSGKSLFIAAEAKFRKPVFTKCVIKAYFRQLDSLVVRCEGGKVVCATPITVSVPLEVKIQSEGDTDLNINAPAIKLLNQSEGNVVIKGACNSISISNQAEGDFNARELVAGELKIKNMAEGNVELYATDTIQISHFGEGYIHYYGTATLKGVKQYGEGPVKYMKE